MVAFLCLLAFVFLLLWIVFSFGPSAPPWVAKVCMILWAAVITMLACNVQTT